MIANRQAWSHLTPTSFHIWLIYVFSFFLSAFFLHGERAEPVFFSFLHRQSFAPTFLPTSTFLMPHWTNKSTMRKWKDVGAKGDYRWHFTTRSIVSCLKVGTRVSIYPENWLIGKTWRKNKHYSLRNISKSQNNLHKAARKFSSLLFISTLLRITKYLLFDIELLFYYL